MWRSYSRLLLLGGSVLFIFILSAFTIHPGIQQNETPPAQAPEPDLSKAIIRLEDLPAGFVELPESQKKSMESALRMFEGQLHGSEIQNFGGYWTGSATNLHMLVSGLVGPLTAADQISVDQSFARPAATYEQISKALNGEEAKDLPGAAGIGSSNLAFSTLISSAGISLRLEYIVARRGPVLVEVAYFYMADKEPVVNTVDIARLLDDRVAQVVGRGTVVTFRHAGPAVPELTTYIPTPLDISTEPGVVGANLFLAVIMMLPFAVAAELFTRTLGEHEEALKSHFKPVGWLRTLQQRLDAASVSPMGRHPARFEVLKLLGVVVFYGLVFSLLDRTWNPFSLKGVVLFVSMTVAYGMIGIADDFFQYRTVRKWGLPAELKVRPTNFLLAVGSTATSRLAALAPGLMFGTPEALCLDESTLDEDKRRRLLKVSARTLITIGLAVWLPTIITSRLPLVMPEGAALSIIGGVEAFLLVLFAVALENTFVQMLGFPDGFGEALKKKNRWLWLVGLVMVTFAFLHTLLNPRGELVQALKQGNVIVFLVATGGFVVVSLALHFYFRGKKQAEKTGRAAIGGVSSAGASTLVGEIARVSQAPLAGDSQITTASQTGARLISTPGQVSRADIQKQPIYAPIEGTKMCPVCCNPIKAEARLCRYCRATFTVRLRGYCLADHTAAEVIEGNRCTRCGGELVDVHVESYLLQAPVLPAQAIQPAPQTSGDTKTCPNCGQTIKAEARLCRFCRATLG